MFETLYLQAPLDLLGNLCNPAPAESQSLLTDQARAPPAGSGQRGPREEVCSGAGEEQRHPRPGAQGTVRAGEGGALYCEEWELFRIPDFLT